MARDHVLHLDRVDVLAAADDHVLQPVGDVDEARLVHEAGVARPHPAVSQRLCGLFGTVPVADHHVVAAADDLAQRAPRDLVPLGIDHLDLVAVAGLAHRLHLLRVCARPVVLGGQEGMRAHLGHAEALDEIDLGEGRARYVVGAQRHRRAAIAQDLQPAGGGRLGMAGQAVDDRRHREDVGDAPALDQVEHHVLVQAADEHMGAADHGGHEGADVGQVEHRRGVQVDDRLVDLERHGQVDRHSAQRPVGQHHPLGQARRAAGIEDAGQVVGLAFDLDRRIRVGDKGLDGVVCRLGGPVHANPGPKLRQLGL